MNLTASDIIAIVAAGIALASAIVSVIAVYVPWRNTHDSEIFAEAVRALERAYEVLTEQGKETGPPRADRLNWLTTARHIESFKSLKTRLKTKLYRTLCEENEEYWRHQFYLTLFRNPRYTEAYYVNGQIEPRSALILYSFASWPKGKRDPIDLLDLKEFWEESEEMRLNAGFKEYLRRFPQYADQV